MSHSQFHCTGRAYLDMHGLIFETSICYWQDQPGRGSEHGEPGVPGKRGREARDATRAPRRASRKAREAREPGARGALQGPLSTSKPPEQILLWAEPPRPSPVSPQGHPGGSITRAPRLQHRAWHRVRVQWLLTDRNLRTGCRAALQPGVGWTCYV